MAIYLCYGCDEYKDSDDGSYESMIAKTKEVGEKQFQDVCEECHDAEVEKLGYCSDCGKPYDSEWHVGKSCFNGPFEEEVA